MSRGLVWRLEMDLPTSDAKEREVAKSRMGQTVGAVVVTTMFQGYNTISGSACGIGLQGKVGNNDPNSGCNYTVYTDFIS